MSGSKSKHTPMRNHHSYDKCSEFEKEKLKKGYRRIREYADYYLYGKYNSNGEFLYRECFSKFDVDGVKAVQKTRDPLQKYK